MSGMRIYPYLVLKKKEAYLARTLQLTVLFVVILFGYSIVADSDFESWKTEFRQSALSVGIQHETLDMTSF